MKTGINFVPEELCVVNFIHAMGNVSKVNKFRYHTPLSAKKQRLIGPLLLRVRDIQLKVCTSTLLQSSKEM